jgi:adenine phosphoribosyltransferase
MQFNDYKQYFSTKSIGRYDVTPIFSNIKVFKTLINDLIIPFTNENIDKIVCIDAIGFIIGSAISISMNKGLILVRKEGKLPIEDHNLIKRIFIDYSGKQKTIEMNKWILKPNENVLLIDDWIETGSQMHAVISMMHELKTNIIGISVIGSDRNEQTESLFTQYNLHSIGINV